MISQDTIALIITILVAVLGGIIYGNKRIDDLRSEMTAGFAAVNVRFDEVHRRIDDLRSEMRAGFADIRGDLRALAEALRARTG